jgi:hypothetical protein
MAFAGSVSFSVLVVAPVAAAPVVAVFVSDPVVAPIAAAPVAVAPVSFALSMVVFHSSLFSLFQAYRLPPYQGGLDLHQLENRFSQIAQISLLFIIGLRILF